MLRTYQTTIKNSVSFEGIGLHSGKKSKIRILPGDADTGLIFKRTDLTINNIIKAKYDNVSSARLCTALENAHGVKVSTVEHLLAALALQEIDNAIIEIDNEEVPIMDGSAAKFVEILEKTEKLELSKKVNYLKVLSKLEVIDGARKISIEPSDHFEVDFELNYENKIIGNQRNLVNFQLDNLNDIVVSRTFCLYEDIEKIKKFGLAKGGSLENAIVVGQDKILNEEGLRNKKEFVNHKILDLAGDFILSGYKIIGKVNCCHGGHQLTNIFLRKLLKKQATFNIIQNRKTIFKKTKINQSTKLAVNA